jgi:hypothetical protein
MAEPQDALAFQREIRVAEFWRKQLGELEYSARNPDDLFRWYEAMELRGPEEIRAYLDERMGRYPTMPVTGIVPVAPHPTRDIIDLWLASHTTTRTGHYWTASAALLLVCIWFVPTLHGCMDVQNPDPPHVWLPQAATLTAGTLSGAPLPVATMPSSPPPPPVSVASPLATTIAAQNGSATPSSTPLGAMVGLNSSSARVSTSSTSMSSLSQPTAGATASPTPLGSFSSQGSQHH